MLDNETKRINYNALRRKWRKDNPDKVKSIKRKHYLENAEDIRAKARARHKNNPWPGRERLWKKQGIKNSKGKDFIYDDYEYIIISQDGCCAICKTRTPGSRGWCLDHSHETGIARGILCTPCNLGTGFLKDSIIIVEAALTYLKANA